MAPRKGLLGLGLAGVGLAGGYAAERALIARQRRRPDASADIDMALRPEVRGTSLTMGDGARLRVVQQGHGPAVLLLHGITLSAAIWHFQLPALADAGYRAIAYDQRGHGASTVGSEGLTLDRLAADLGEVLDQLLIDDDVLLVGHSMGGMVALRHLASVPGDPEGTGRISGLALVATSADPVVGSGIPGIGALIGAGAPVLARLGVLSRRLPGPSLGAGDLSFLLTRVTFGADPSTSQVALTRDVTNAVPAKVAVELLAQIVSFDETPVLERIAVPATVVVGTNDLMTPVPHARALARKIRGSELVVLDGCGHQVMVERPSELNAAILDLAHRAGPAGTLAS
jgi:pimeloyl-ACP methyl ester carboxylesterase